MLGQEPNADEYSEVSHQHRCSLDHFKSGKLIIYLKYLNSHVIYDIACILCFLADYNSKIIRRERLRTCQEMKNELQP